MILDNLFSMLGGLGTAFFCLGIVVFLGAPAALVVLREASPCGARIPRLERSR